MVKYDYLTYKIKKLNISNIDSLLNLDIWSRVRVYNTCEIKNY